MQAFEILDVIETTRWSDSTKDYSKGKNRRGFVSKSYLSHTLRTAGEPFTSDELDGKFNIHILISFL